jgi:deoxyribodipyrimidine photolyase
MNNKPVVIHWFRKGLRLHDNPALLNALEKVKSCLITRFNLA